MSLFPDMSSELLADTWGAPGCPHWNCQITLSPGQVQVTELIRDFTVGQTALQNGSGRMLEAEIQPGGRTPVPSCYPFGNACPGTSCLSTLPGEGGGGDTGHMYVLTR